MKPQNYLIQILNQNKISNTVILNNIRKYLRSTTSEFILQNNIRYLPVDPFPIAERNHWETLTYSQFSAIIGKSKSYLIKNYDAKGFVFFSSKKQTFIICYNSSLPFNIIRWTIVHEMGHIYLKHISGENPLIRRNDAYKHFLKLKHNFLPAEFYALLYY